MKSKNLFLCIFLLFFWMISGCAIPEQEMIVDVTPQIVEQYPLPSMPASIRSFEFKLDTKLFVSEDGNVVQAKLLNSSFDSEWDSLTVKQLLKWRFTPAKLKGQPVPIWIHQPITIRFQEIFQLRLAELVCDSKETIDSLYLLLKNGEDFGKLAQKYSVSESRQYMGVLGNVDLRKYHMKIQVQLESLKNNQFSTPLLINKQYYIFKRLE